MRQLSRFHSFPRDVVYFPRNGNPTRKGNIAADGVPLAGSPAGKKSKVVTIDLGDSLFTELAEGRSREEKRSDSSEEGGGGKVEDLVAPISPTNNYRRIGRQ